MEAPKQRRDYSSLVDTSSAFRSVKEAVAIFGERILVGEMCSPSPRPLTYSQEITSWRFSSPTPSPNQNPNEDDQEPQRSVVVLDALKKLEAELKETKAELKLLKERESETEIALASLNAELHKNMSKLAEAEAAAAKKAATLVRAVSCGRENKEDALKEEERRSELMKRMEGSPTLDKILSLGEEKGHFGGKKQRKSMKKKPIVPLVGDFFFRRNKSSSNGLESTFHSSVCFN